MVVTLETIHKDIQKIINELVFLQHVMEEEYELSDEARQKLQSVREHMDKGEYISHETVVKKYG